MQLRSFLPLLALAATACTFTPQSNGSLKTDFHPPIVAPQWHISAYKLQNGIKACAISSGYNGVTIKLGAFPNGVETEAESTRRMEPGDSFTINANGGYFQAYGTYFSADTAARMPAAFSKGGTAYLEWSQISGSTSQERIHIQNIVPLDDFAAKFAECQKAIAQ